MHPRMTSCGSSHPGHGRECGCGPRVVTVEASRHHRHFSDPGLGGGPFGVRRPLRFLAWKLGLREDQVTGLASVLDELKTERAQHEVDDRRSLALLADAVTSDAFDRGKMDEASRMRVESAQRLQAQVAKTVERIHALLDAEQRARFAYLIRTGTLSM